MTMFKLTLEKTYYRKGFFNITVEFDRFVSSVGSVELVLGTSMQTIESRIDRRANRNGAPRIMGGAKLRDWFQANYAEGDVIEVDLSSFSSIQIGGGPSGRPDGPNRQSPPTSAKSGQPDTNEMADGELRKSTSSQRIQGEQREREEFSRTSRGRQQSTRAPAVELNGQAELSSSRNCFSFESCARTVLPSHFSVPLPAGQLPNVPKKFDLVSADGTIVGDAKYFDMVRGKDNSPAKFSIIAEHVWLLERTDARVRFLVFGNNRLVPTGWLKKYGHLAHNVSFLFLDENGVLEVLV